MRSDYSLYGPTETRPSRPTETRPSKNDRYGRETEDLYIKIYSYTSSCRMPSKILPHWSDGNGTTDRSPGIRYDWIAKQIETHSTDGWSNVQGPLVFFTWHMSSRNPRRTLHTTTDISVPNPLFRTFENHIYSCSPHTPSSSFSTDKEEVVDGTRGRRVRTPGHVWRQVFVVHSSNLTWDEYHTGRIFELNSLLNKKLGSLFHR